MDMCNGEILSYGIDKKPSAKNVMDALEKAIEVTSDCPYRRTFHSDQGWAYQMKAYSRRPKEERIFQSMSRVIHCIDNGSMEGFWGILKRKMYYRQHFNDRSTLIAAITDYINYYNNQRLQRKLNVMTPMEYHNQYIKAA